VDGSIDAIRDAELINLELCLADLGQVEKRLERVTKDRKADPNEKSALEKVLAVRTTCLASKPTIHLGRQNQEHGRFGRGGRHPRRLV
jgi:ribosome-binding ATPase YchF (GTP1/OBG family)